MRAARHAGMADVASPTIISTTATPTYVAGSVVLTPNTRLRSSRAERESDPDAEGDAPEEKPQPVAQEETQHGRWRRANRHANADLANPLPHGMRHDAVEPEARHRHRHEREHREGDAGDAAVLRIRLSQPGHRRCVVDRQLGIGVRDGGSHGSQRGRWIAGATRHDEETSGRALRIWQVQLRLGAAIKTAIAHVADNADDLAPAAVLLVAFEVDPFAYRVLAREIPVREGLVDDSRRAAGLAHRAGRTLVRA